MARRSIRDLFAKNAKEQPALNPEMRSLILSFDAHLQKRSPKADQEPQDRGSVSQAAVDDAPTQVSGAER